MAHSQRVLWFMLSFLVLSEGQPRTVLASQQRYKERGLITPICPGKELGHRETSKVKVAMLGFELRQPSSSADTLHH